MVEADAPERPLLTIGRGWAVCVGPVEPGRLHRHQAAQPVWCSQGTVTLEGAWGVLDTPGHYLPAGVPHRLAASRPVCMVFLDPTKVGGAPPLGPTAAVTALTALHADVLEHELHRWLQNQSLPDTENSPDRPTDLRWLSVFSWLEQALDEPVRVEDAADAVGLSSSLFMHGFSDVSGLSFRACVRWLRLQRAVRALAEGNTLTEAAHLAGFADSAHLTRTFVATFGVRPAPLRGMRIVCDDRAKPPLTAHGLALVETV